MEPKLTEPVVRPGPTIKWLDSSSVKEPEFKVLNNELVSIMTPQSKNNNNDNLCTKYQASLYIYMTSDQSILFSLLNF